MTIYHSKFGLRTLKPGYWYSTAQIEQVGLYWKRENPKHRLFCISEQIACIGLRSLPRKLLSKLPYEIICPVNKGGNHWVSFAIKVTQNEQGCLVVNVSYSDSLSTNSKIPPVFEKELLRIYGLFKKADPNFIGDIKYYNATWMQKDGSSCGPYSIKNAQRFLEGDEKSPNPGQLAIRSEQLLMMSKASAVIGCSVSLKLDDILIYWLAQQPNLKPNQINSAMIKEMIASYAHHYQEEEAAVERFMRQELMMNATEAFFVFPIKNRINELKRHYAGRFQNQDFIKKHHELLIIENSLSQSVLASEKQSESINKNEHENAPGTYDFSGFAELFDNSSAVKNELELSEILAIISKEVFSKAAVKSKQVLMLLLAQIYQGHLEDAVQMLSQIYEEESIPDTCLNAISQLSHCADPAWNDLGVTCTQFFEAAELLNASENELKTLNNLPQSKQALDAHLSLLNLAIERAGANYFMSMIHIVSDFCSAFLEFLSSGIWELDYEKIETIKQQLLSESNQSPEFFKKQLTLEIESIDNCIVAQEVLNETVERLGDLSMPKI